MNGTTFVTGGSGFIGGRLIRHLVADGVSVRALARSDRAAAAVQEAGAEPVRGDLDDVDALRRGAEGCTFAFHAAAKVEAAGPWAEFERINVRGTENVLTACREAGVRRFVHVGTEAALLAGEPLIEADERAPLRFDSPVPYSRSKAMAEAAVVSAARDGFETVVIRPRFVWGAGDTTLLPAMTAMVREGRFAWIGGGRHLTSTTHVDNAVHGLRLGAEKGGSGEAYFVTDDGAVVWREWITELLETQGVTPPGRNIPTPVASAAAAATETAWKLLRRSGEPPLSRFAVWVSSQECTLDISRARAELGYEPVRTREDGLAELRAAGAS
jgi:nucleoside-diphosphate-sugar epimerase